MCDERNEAIVCAKHENTGSQKCTHSRPPDDNNDGDDIIEMCMWEGRRRGRGRGRTDLFSHKSPHIEYNSTWNSEVKWFPW